jgi:hypothetical protein
MPKCTGITLEFFHIADSRLERLFKDHLDDYLFRARSGLNRFCLPVKKIAPFKLRFPAFVFGKISLE